MKNKMTFEQAATELDAILEELSSDETPLDRALSLYAKAAELISYCSGVLKDAQITVDEINVKFAVPEM